jgi:signal peptidase I
MTMPQSGTPQASVITSLFIQALREGHSSWFRVASNSMNPLIRLGDSVYIQSAQASQIRVGEIAAFETTAGLVIHRIIHRQQAGATVRLFQMSDVELLPGWVREQAIVGRVIRIRHDSYQIDLLHPIAKRCGTIAAYIRYTLYSYDKCMPLRIALRICSRLAINFGHWYIRRCCTSPARGE